MKCRIKEFVVIIIGIVCVLLLNCDSNLQVEMAGTSDGYGSLGGDGGLKNDINVCANVNRKAELPPMDMLIGLDTSYSMDFLLKWESVKAALKEFVKDPRFIDLGVGLQYFPLRAQCKVSDYASPAVPIGPLSSTADAIINSLDAQQMAGGTPMVPLMQGLVEYARAHVTQNNGRKIVIILVSDGIPDNTCLTGTYPNTLDNVIALAQEGASGSPAIPTFVIGVGNELSSLNQISAAGGTGNAFLIDTSKDIQQGFLQALNDIRREMSCEYKIPELSGYTTRYDYKNVRVQFSQDGQTEILTNIKSKDGCSTAPEKGWYFDDPQKPTQIILCDQTCHRVQKSDTAKVDVLFSCIEIPE